MVVWDGTQAWRAIANKQNIPKMVSEDMFPGKLATAASLPAHLVLQVEESSDGFKAPRSQGDVHMESYASARHPV